MLDYVMCFVMIYYNVNSFKKMRPEVKIVCILLLKNDLGFSKLIKEDSG